MIIFRFSLAKMLHYQTKDKPDLFCCRYIFNSYGEFYPSTKAHYKEGLHLNLLSRVAHKKGKIERNCVFW
jgi:hypothetical protein